MSTKAQQFLEQKLRETIAECAVPALAAVLVRDAGSTIVSGQQGVRKLGASGAGNAIQPTDKFNLGSISKVFTANLIGKLIQDGIGGLQWSTQLGSVYASIWDVPASRDGYKQVTIEQLIAHTSGMPYTPAADQLNDWKTYTAADMTKPKLMARRRTYIKAAVLDAPSYWPPGSGFEYSGGGIIAASMAEHKTGQTYEDMLQQHIFQPLGMTNSGSGVTSTAALNGPWEHAWNADTMTTTPDPDTHKPAYSWHCRAPVGSVCMSADDMGKFIREQIRPDPQLFTAATRSTMQTHQVSTATSFVRGGWSSTQPGSSQAEIWHTGDIGVSYAALSVHLDRKFGFASMSNTNSTFAGPAAGEMLLVARAMHDHWNELFGTGSPELIEGVHPVPAITLAGVDMMLFGRRHDGKVFRSRSTDSGAHWQAAGDFGPVRINSGLGAAASSDGQRLYVIGRGLDNHAWFGWSTDGGAHWQGWVPIRAGVFITGPAIACSANGSIVHAVGIGNDKRMWRTHSVDAGAHWVDWTPIGEGVFTSAPALAVSADGKVVHAVARGNDMRAWHNVSFDSGASFKPHWAPVGLGIFTSGLGAAVSDDGKRVHFMGRGTDGHMWRNTSTDSGSTWQAHWEAVPDGAFTSAPSLATSSNGLVLNACAFGSDFRVWGNRSTDGGHTWSGWGQKTSDFFI